jgi:hypothetical protein
MQCSKEWPGYGSHITVNNMPVYKQCPDPFGIPNCIEFPSLTHMGIVSLLIQQIKHTI